MKQVLVFAAVALIGPTALACPGGHLKSLVDGDVTLAEVDMSVNRVRVVDDRTELLSISWTPEQQEITRLVCGHPMAEVEVCDHDQGLLDIDLNSNHGSTLLVSLRRGKKELEYKVTNFRRTRGSCGGTVEPQ